MAVPVDWKSLLASVIAIDASYRRPPASSWEIDDAKRRADEAKLHLPEEVLNFYRHTNGFDINGTDIVPLTRVQDRPTLFDIQIDLAANGETVYGMAGDDILLYQPTRLRYQRTTSSADVVREYSAFAELLEEIVATQLEMLRMVARSSYFHSISSSLRNRP